MVQTDNHATGAAVPQENPPARIRELAATKRLWLASLPPSMAARLECQVAKYLHLQGVTTCTWPAVRQAVLAHTNPGTVWAVTTRLRTRTGGPLPTCRDIRTHYNIPARRRP